MWTLSLISFLLLGGFLLLSAMRYGIPDMVSDTFYQLQHTTGSEIIGTGKKRNFGWVFTLVMVVVAFLMAMYLLNLGKGIQFFAFIGCCGLAFVGVTPNYIDQSEGRVHKAAATIAAVGCVAWCISVNAVPTVLIAVILALYLALMSIAKALNGIWYLTKKSLSYHPWYWAEVAAFADVFVTGWIL